MCPHLEPCPPLEPCPTIKPCPHSNLSHQSKLVHHVDQGYPLTPDQFLLSGSFWGKSLDKPHIQLIIGHSYFERLLLGAIKARGCSTQCGCYQQINAGSMHGRWTRQRMSGNSTETGYTCKPKKDVCACTHTHK